MAVDLAGHYLPYERPDVLRSVAPDWLDRSGVSQPQSCCSRTRVRIASWCGLCRAISINQPPSHGREQSGRFWRGSSALVGQETLTLLQPSV